MQPKHVGKPPEMRYNDETDMAAAIMYLGDDIEVEVIGREGAENLLWKLG